MIKYYDGTKLLSLMDINGNKPEIYISTSNRTAGKTTYFNRYVVRRFLKYNEKFMLIYRFTADLSGIADRFFKNIRELFFPNYIMSSQKDPSGAFHNLWIQANGQEPMHCGYAVALNAADKIKQNSHLMSDTARMLFDEFQSETNHYCDREIDKLQSVHTSIARGGNEFVRYVPLFMISNMVSLINPYFVALGISDRLRSDTKFLRGPGWVLEQGFNRDAASALSGSGFMQSFGESKYLKYATQNTYLNDNLSFIDKPEGRGKYLATVAYNDNYYAIRSFATKGIIYCDTAVDKTFPTKLALTTQDHQINYVMLRSSEVLIQSLRWYFEHGCFRFKNLQCKECILRLVSYY